MPETQGSRPDSKPDGGVRPPPDVLRRIVRTKEKEVAALGRRSEAVWAEAREAPEPRDFRGALRLGSSVALIAEVKRRSPGAGDIRPDLDPAGLAADYAGSGAAALSVLTDARYFGGSLDDLRRVRAAVDIPLLRKDFTLVPDQVAEARAAGADAVLLIVRILEGDRLRELAQVAAELGLAALVEVHDATDLERAVAAGAELIGINNRDLTRFVTDLGTTRSLLAGVPEDVVVVSESGIRDTGDVDTVGGWGVDAVLVGEALLRAPDPAEAAAGMTGRPRAHRRGGGAGR
ncbi:MAG TPA: indole-3-glycerol phosphate synthase TrpC [Longimicrobiales bacterium]